MKMRRLAALALLVSALASGGAGANFCGAGAHPNLSDTFPPELNQDHSGFKQNGDKYELTIAVNVPSKYTEDKNEVKLALGHPGQQEAIDNNFNGPQFSEAGTNTSRERNEDECYTTFSWTIEWSKLFGDDENYLVLLDQRSNFGDRKAYAYMGIVLAQIKLQPKDVDGFEDVDEQAFLWQIPFTLDFPDMVTASLAAETAAGIGEDTVSVVAQSATLRPTDGFAEIGPGGQDKDGFTEVTMVVTTTAKKGYRIKHENTAGDGAEDKEEWGITEAVPTKDGSFQQGTVTKKSSDGATTTWEIKVQTAFKCDLSNVYKLTFGLECIDADGNEVDEDGVCQNGQKSSDLGDAQIDLVLTEANVCPRVNDGKCKAMDTLFEPVTKMNGDGTWPYEYDGNSVSVSIKVNKKGKIDNSVIWFEGNPQEDPTERTDDMAARRSWGAMLKKEDGKIEVRSFHVDNSKIPRDAKKNISGVDSQWVVQEENECYVIVTLEDEEKNWKRFAKYCDSEQPDVCWPSKYKPKDDEKSALWKLVVNSPMEWNNVKGQKNVSKVEYIKLASTEFFPRVRFDKSKVSGKFRPQNSKFSIIKHETTTVPLVNNTGGEKATLELVIATTIQYPYVFGSDGAVLESDSGNVDTPLVEALDPDCSGGKSDRLNYTTGRLSVKDSDGEPPAVFDEPSEDVNLCIQRWKLTLQTSEQVCNFTGDYTFKANAVCKRLEDGKPVAECENTDDPVEFGLSIDEDDLCKNNDLGEVFMTKTLQAYSHVPDLPEEPDDNDKQNSWVKTGQPKMLATLQLEDDGGSPDTKFKTIKLIKVEACTEAEDNICKNDGWKLMHKTTSPYYLFNKDANTGFGCGNPPMGTEMYGCVSDKGSKAQVSFGLNLNCDMDCISEKDNADDADCNTNDNKKCCFKDGVGIPKRTHEDCEQEDTCQWRERKQKCDGDTWNVQSDQIESRPVRATFEVEYEDSRRRRRRVMVTNNPTAVAQLYILPSTAAASTLAASVAPPASTSWNFVLFVTVFTLATAVLAMSVGLWCCRNSNRPKPTMYQQMEQGETS